MMASNGEFEPFRSTRNRSNSRLGQHLPSCGFRLPAVPGHPHTTDDRRWAILDTDGQRPHSRVASFVS